MMRPGSIALAVALAAVAGAPAAGQQRQGPPPPNAQAGAPDDLTGQWVSIVTEDWRWRMITPPKGDYTSVPLSPAGKAAADTWDLAADDAAQLQCKAFGVGGIMRMPTRLRISWQDPNTLKLETDAGQQVRQFHFLAAAPQAELPELVNGLLPAGDKTWQGYTRAQWLKLRQSRGLGYGAFTGKGGALRAVTRGMRAGYLRKNGVPYSENAVITEQFNLFKLDDKTTLLTVTTIVDDPANLTEPFITSSEFKRETDRTKWSPTPCRTDPPLEPPVPDKPREG